VIPVVSQLLSQEQDFRSYGCSGAGGEVQEPQSIPQQFPEDSKAGAEVTLPKASAPKGGTVFNFDLRFEVTASKRSPWASGIGR
jgi:hypothetical protein